MSAVDIFQYAGQQVRTLIIDGEPWFVASDVARVLGYSATEAMTRSMDADEKGMQNLQTLGGVQSVTSSASPDCTKRSSAVASPPPRTSSAG